MRYHAKNEVVVILALVVLECAPLRADNVADCEDPPGGRITCEDRQAAFCKVVKGKVDGYCKTPSRDLAGPRLSAWVLSEATGKTVSPNEITEPSYARILKTREWRSAESVVTFSAPKTQPREE